MEEDGIERGEMVVTAALIAAVPAFLETPLLAEWNRPRC